MKSTMSYRLAVCSRNTVFATSLIRSSALPLVLRSKNRCFTTSGIPQISQKSSSLGSQTAPASSVAPAAADAANPSAQKSTGPNLKYLDTVSNRELLSYFLIGLSTLNKTTLDLAVKVFPYLPVSLMKAFVSNIYCGGDNAQDVTETGKKLANRNINNMMISFTIEDSDGTKNLDINYIVDETIKSVDDILIPHTEEVIAQAVKNGGSANDVPAGYVALKPSALVADPAGVMKNYKDAAYAVQYQVLVDNCSRIIEHIYKRNKELAKKYPERKVPLIVGVIDAEKFELQQAVYHLQRTLFKKFNPKNEPVSVVGTIQMYLKQSYDVLVKEKELAEKEGYKVGLKLVRGAYIHTEPDRKNVIHDTKHETDVNYNKGIKLAIEDILAADKPVIGHLVVASHNRESQVNATNLLGKYSKSSQKNNITLAQLLGMADDITYDLVKNFGVKNIIKYVPWGPPLETRDYLLRRLEENGDAVRNDNGLPLIKNVISASFRRLFQRQ